MKPPYGQDFAKSVALFWIVAITIFTTTGCAHNSDFRAEPSSPASKERWQGRIAVAVESSPKQAFSAYFELEGNRQNGRMELSTALGTTLAQLQWSAQNALLKAGGVTHNYNSLRELTLATMGAELPMDALLLWLQGVPANSEGWQSDLSEFESGKLNAQRLTPEPRVNLKIVLDR